MGQEKWEYVDDWRDFSNHMPVSEKAQPKLVRVHGIFRLHEKREYIHDWRDFNNRWDYVYINRQTFVVRGFNHMPVSEKAHVKLG